MRVRVGFIGLGVMGLPMAGHLAAAGHALTVLDMDPARGAVLKSLHPQVATASTPAEVARAAEVVITMLPSGEPVRAVTLGDDGLMSGLAEGTVLLDTSSSEPWITRELADALGRRHVEMVDAPVSGAEKGARAAELVFMAGGSPAALQRVRPLLEVMGGQVFHLGPTGSGHVMKAVNNLITAVNFMATAEGLLIARRNGLDPAVANDVLNASTGQSWITANHIGQRILSRTFDDPFKLSLMLKDMGIAMQLARQAGLEVPLAGKALARWRAAEEFAGTGASVSAMVRWLEEITATELVAGPCSRPERDT